MRVKDLIEQGSRAPLKELLAQNASVARAMENALRGVREDMSPDDRPLVAGASRPVEG